MRRNEEDFNEEIRSHLELETERLVAEGLTPAEAAAQARRAFGNVTTVRERFFDSRRSAWLTQLARDLRFTFRWLRKHPGAALAVVGTFALGMGATTAVVSVIDSVLLRPAPYPNGERLWAVSEIKPAESSRRGTVAAVKLAEWNREARTVQGAAGYYTESQSDTTGALPEKVTWAVATPGFFSVLGVRPEWGRDFTREEEQPAGPVAVIVSPALWSRHFGAPRDPAGATIRLGRSAFTIVGVLAASFVPPEPAIDLWVPARLNEALGENREARFFTSVVRLKEGVGREMAEAELRGIHARHADARVDRGWSVAVEPFTESSVAGVRRTLWVLGAAVGLLLLIACANVAGLLLAQGRARQREIEMRLALGASRSQIIRQLLTESATLSLLGAAVGLLVAHAAIRFFQNAAMALPRAGEISLDGRILAITAALAVATGLASGMFPAWPLLRRSERSLAGAGRGTLGSVGGRAQLWIAAMQVAFTLVLLAGSGLMMRTLANLRRVDPGFTAEGVLSLRVSAGWGETVDMPRVAKRLQATLDALESIPGVSGAALATSLPGAQTPAPEKVQLQGRSEPVTALSYAVSPRFFSVLQVPLLSGATCEAGRPAVLVNASFARHYLSGVNAIGWRISGGSGEAAIAGVVADFRDESPARDPAPAVYHCGIPGFFPDPHYLVRATGVSATAIRQKLREIMPARSVFQLLPLADRLDGGSDERRFQMLVLGSFAATALLLAAVGVFGLISQSVQARTREFGLRIAVGASAGNIAACALRQTVWAVGTGSAAGVVLSLAGLGVLRASLFGVHPADPVVLAGSLLTIALAALAAAARPVWRALRVDPVQALRLD